MKNLHMKKYTRTNLLTYLGVIVAFVVMNALSASGSLSRSLTGQLVPICCYMSMAVSLNLTVGILGELSLGHAGFMSVGAFSGIVAAMSLQNAIPSAPLRLAIAMAVGAAAAALADLKQTILAESRRGAIQSGEDLADLRAALKQKKGYGG